MSPIVRIRLLLSPSISSGVVCAVLSLAVIGGAAWSFISQNLLFYDFLFGRNGITTTLLTTNDHLSPLKVRLASSPITYRLTVLVVALMAGAIVYVLLQGVSRFIELIKLLIRDTHQHTRAARLELLFTLERGGVVVAGLLGWAAYVIAFLGLLVPFAIALLQSGIGLPSEHNPTSWLSIIAAVVLLAISLHVHVVFARLCMLRLRLFGSSDFEMAGGH